MPEKFEDCVDWPPSPGDLDLLALIEEIGIEHASRFNWGTPYVTVWLYGERGRARRLQSPRRGRHRSPDKERLSL